VQDIASGTAPTALDAFAEAQMLAANVGAQITAIVTNPATALVLANMKEATRSGKPLLQPDPTQPTCRMIFGVLLLTSPEAAVGTIRGLPAERVVTAVRCDAEVTADRSAINRGDNSTEWRAAELHRAQLRGSWPNPSTLCTLRLT
jgi:hypothetical protein